MESLKKYLYTGWHSPEVIEDLRKGAAGPLKPFKRLFRGTDAVWLKEVLRGEYDIPFGSGICSFSLSSQAAHDALLWEGPWKRPRRIVVEIKNGKGWRVDHLTDLWWQREVIVETKIFEAVGIYNYYRIGDILYVFIGPPRTPADRGRANELSWLEEFSDIL